MTDHEKLAAEQAAGLRAIADMIEANPELAENFRHSLNRSGINMHLRPTDRAAQLADIARIALRHGVNVAKDIDDQWHNLVLTFGTVKVAVLAYRSDVCERVVTGTKTITKTVKDPAALAAVPDIQVTEDVEIVEWQCTPLLATGGQS